MSNATLILGASGSGKSTSLRNLDPAETFIVNVLGKPLPFRGYKKMYTPITGWDDKENNYYASDDWIKILKCIQVVNKRPEIKILVIDDFVYVMSNEFMRRSSEKGYEKFSELASHVHSLVQELMTTREDLLCFVLTHSDIDATGFNKVKTIGKMLDEKVTLEGMFTTILHAQVIDGEYKFLTQNNGSHLAKSPLGLFYDKYIDNDLVYVNSKLKEYYE